MYTIRINKAESLVEVRLTGMMCLIEVTKYIQDLRTAFVQNHLRSYAMVIDISDCPIQSQEMIKAMGEHMGHMPKARAIALVTGSSLARMQAKRLFTQPYARMAMTIADGRAWVLNGVEPTTH